jgi:spermidine/putrescine transport system substrate-binding protein
MKSISEFKLGRRQFMAASAAGAATLAAPGILRSAYAADEITIFTWETYHEDAWLAEWTKETGIKVNVVRTGGVDEMYAQASSGAVPADVFYIDSGSIKRYQEAKLIVPIDVAKLPEAANISAGLKYEQRNAVDGKLYGVPYNWGTQPLMFDEEVVKGGTDSWQILWDKNFAGKVSLFDDAYITFPMIALKVGAKDPYNLTDDEFELCRQALVELRPQVKTIARGFNDAEALYASGDASLGYCQNISTVYNLQAKGRKFNYSFPKEGTPTWIDNAVISEKGNRPAVYQFLNDNLKIAWQSRFITFSVNNGVLTEEGATKGGVAPEIMKKTNIIDQSQPGFWDKMSVFMFPESIDRRVQMWNDFKAGTL